MISASHIGNIRIAFADRPRLFVRDPPQHGRRRAGAERSMARAHEIKHASQAEEVRSMVDGLAAGLLGRHVLRRAGHDPALGETGVVDRPCQTEIGELDAFDPVFQQDIRRLDVAMNQTLRVSRREPLRRLDADAQDRLQIHRPVAVDSFLQRLTGDVGHDQVRQICSTNRPRGSPPRFRERPRRRPALRVQTGFGPRRSWQAAAPAP